MDQPEEKRGRDLPEIIIGEEPIEAFDTFVEEWNAEGGAEITEEVQALTEK